MHTSMSVTIVYSSVNEQVLSQSSCLLSRQVRIGQKAHGNRCPIFSDLFLPHDFQTVGRKNNGIVEVKLQKCKERTENLQQKNIFF